MKKIVLSMVALLSMTVAVAQDAKSDKKAPKEPTAEEMTNRMAQDLKLTDEQKTKVLALNKEYQDVLKAPRGPRGPRPEGKQGKRPQTDGKTEATEQQGGKPFHYFLGRLLYSSSASARSFRASLRSSTLSTYARRTWSCPYCGSE